MPKHVALPMMKRASAERRTVRVVTYYGNEEYIGYDYRVRAGTTMRHLWTSIRRQMGTNKPALFHDLMPADWSDARLRGDPVLRKGERVKYAPEKPVYELFAPGSDLLRLFRHKHDAE